MEDNSQWSEWRHGYGSEVMSPEIIELEETKSFTNNNDGPNDVYIAVGKDDMDVLKWTLNHAVLPGTRVFLIHVFPPINYIPTPVGRLSRGQVSQEQVKSYIKEENTRRRNILQKYILMCTNAKVAVDTMLIESDEPAKAIMELIPVLNITKLIMGTKRSPSSSRRLRKGLGKGAFVQKNAPDFCEVTLVFDGKKVVEGQQVGLESPSQAPSDRKARMTRNAERNFFDCVCFSGKFV